MRQKLGTTKWLSTKISLMSNKKIATNPKKCRVGMIIYLSLFQIHSLNSVQIFRKIIFLDLHNDLLTSLVAVRLIQIEVRIDEIQNAPFRST